jgi:hypothetical protein
MQEKILEMKIIKNALSIIALISILALTLNVLVVQAAPPAITLNLDGEGNVQVTGYSSKGKVIDLGSYVAPNTFKITGQLAYVEFVLNPNTDANPPFHVYEINQDGTDIEYGNPNLVSDNSGSYTYTLVITEKQHTLNVIFSQTESVTILGGNNDPVNLGMTAQITVEGEHGDLTFIGVQLQDPESLTVWDITTEGFNGDVRVALLFTYSGDPTTGDDAVKLYRTDLEYPNADVTGDNQITADDVNSVSAVNPGTVLGDPDWNATLDINADGVINGEDVNIVAGYNPLRNPPGVWEDITEDYQYLGNDQWLVWGYTDHFSLFRCR